MDTFTSRDELIADWESGWRCLFDSLAKKLSGIADDYFSTPPTVREDDYREADRYLRRAAGCPGLMDPCDRESRR